MTGARAWLPFRKARRGGRDGGSALIPGWLALVLLAGCSGGGAGAGPGNILASTVPVLDTTPGPCPTAMVLNGPIRRFRSPDGGCVVAAQLGEFRCTRFDDPVIEVAGQRFLGGVFAIPLPARPARVRLLGTSGDLSAFAIPGERPTLLVERGGSPERWLWLGAAHPAPSAFVAGDSIMVATRHALVRSLPGWNLRFVAKVGRDTAGGVRAASAAGLAGADVAVVELGTNDNTADGFLSLARRMLSMVGDASLVIWVTVHRDLPFVSSIDDDIRRAISELPNGVVADWAAAAAPADLLSDGIHPSDPGKRLLARLVSGPIRRWYLAATGRGDTSCAPGGSGTARGLDTGGMGS